MKQAKRARVFVVDDEAEFAGAISMLLGAAGIASVVFTSPRKFLRSIKADDAGCILLDIRMPGMSGLEVQDNLLRHGCRQPVIFLTGHGDIPMAVRATQAGAMDFLEKPVREKILISRVNAAFKQDAAHRKEALAKGESGRQVSELSRRELEIGRLLAQGLSSAQMAKKLKLSVRTVEMHRLRMMRRLGVNNTAQAVRMMIEAG